MCEKSFQWQKLLKIGIEKRNKKMKKWPNKLKMSKK